MSLCASKKEIEHHRIDVSAILFKQSGFRTFIAAQLILSIADCDHVIARRAEILFASNEPRALIVSRRIINRCASHTSRPFYNRGYTGATGFDFGILPPGISLRVRRKRKVSGSRQDNPER